MIFGTFDQFDPHMTGQDRIGQDRTGYKFGALPDPTLF